MMVCNRPGTREARTGTDWWVLRTSFAVFPGAESLSSNIRPSPVSVLPLQTVAPDAGGELTVVQIERDRRRVGGEYLPVVTVGIEFDPCLHEPRGFESIETAVHGRSRRVALVDEFSCGFGRLPNRNHDRPTQLVVEQFEHDR
jgi:hypothetical protein